MRYILWCILWKDVLATPLSAVRALFVQTNAVIIQRNKKQTNLRSYLRTILMYIKTHQKMKLRQLTKNISKIGQANRFRQNLVDFPTNMSVSLFVYITIIRTGRTLAKIKNVKIAFVDFDICHGTASLRKLYFVTLTYFLKVKYVKR